MARPPHVWADCSAERCDGRAEIRGLCKRHYQRMRSHGDLAVARYSGDKRSHRYYHLWFERKQSGVLAPEWIDFWNFVRDVGEKPAGNFLIVRLRGDEPYGPTNFKWQEHLKRKPGEPRKEWWARKWAARQANSPGMERARNLRRFYDFTTEAYEAMVAAQNGLCAICAQAETTVDAKSGSRKRLAVDHCHTTKRVRALLCFRCNSTIGKVNESIELLKAITAYLEKYSALSEPPQNQEPSCR